MLQFDTMQRRGSIRQTAWYIGERDMAALGRSFLLPKNSMAMEREGAYSINDEYPINDCFCYR